MAPDAKSPRARYDRKGLTQFLTRWYEAEMRSALRKPRPPKEGEKEGCTVFDIQPEMASTKAVRVLLELTDILGFEPSKEVIKKGGYRSKDEFVKELSSRIEQAFDKHYGTSPPASAKAEKEVNTHAQL